MEIFSDISELREKHYRVLACLIVCVSGNEREIWEQMQMLTDAPIEVPSGNLVLYLTTFCFNLFASLLIGRELSILFYLEFISYTDKIVSLDVNRLKFWFSVSLIMFFAPIALMFAFRRLARVWFPFKSRRYWDIYTFFGVVAFIISVLVLPELTYSRALAPLFSADYWSMVWAALYFGLTTCFLTGIVAYRMDSPASCKDTPKKILADHMSVALICAGAGGLFSFLGAVGSPNLSNPERFVICVR